MSKTRSGLNVTILTRKLRGQSRNIVGIVHSESGDKIEQWYDNGRFYLHAESSLDLKEEIKHTQLGPICIETPKRVELELCSDGIYRIRGYV